MLIIIRQLSLGILVHKLLNILVTCGEGDRTRQRVCGDGSEEPGACPGEPIEYETCNPGKVKSYACNRNQFKK